MTMPTDTHTITAKMLADRPMSRVQMLAVVLAVALNALDGFDVLAMTFAAPDIAAAWGVGPAQLGVALSAGLVGMALGSLVLAPLGDRWGRKPLIISCLALMTLGMGLTATATGIYGLCFWRVVTGFGIGGMLAAINAVAAEFANERRRELCIALMTIGYPVGGLIGGLIVADFIIPYGWQSVFLFGTAITALFVPVVCFLLPESIDFLSRRGDARARRKIDILLAKMGHPAMPAQVAADAPPAEPGGNVAALLGPRYRRVTIVLVSAYFLHMLTFYFFSGWLPKLMSDLGYTTPDAIRTSALMSLGGVIGGLVFGWLAPRTGLVRLLVGAMLATSGGFFLFGAAAGLTAIQTIAFVTGVVLFGGIVGLYALLARSFPAELRVTGTGIAIGIGRGGAIVGPVVGGLLIAQGVSIATAVAVVGAAAVMAAGIIFWGRLPRM